MGLIKKMDGAISIFLCLVLTSMIVLSGFLIDGARIRASESQSQAAAEDSMRSALADYNRMLKDLYGLFALSDGSEESLNEEIESYMNKTLMTELGISKETIGEQMYGYLTSILTNSGTKKDASFLNLFDYGIEELHSESLYNLAQTEVLEKQIIDYMKYRGPREISENFIDKLGMFKHFGKQSGTMKKKVKLDKDLDVVRKDSESLSDAVEYINNFNTQNSGRVDELYRSFVENVSEKAYLELQLQIEQDYMKETKKNMDKLQPEITDAKKDVKHIRQQLADVSSENTSEIRSLRKKLSKAKKVLANLETEYDYLMKSYENSKDKTERYKERIPECKKTASQNIGTVTELISTCINKCSDAESYINRIISDSKNVNNEINDINENLNGETGDFANRIRLDIAGKSSLISTVKLNEIKIKCTENKELLKKLNTLIQSVDYKGINGNELPALLNKDRKSILKTDAEAYFSRLLKNQEVMELLSKYNGRCNQNPIAYSVKKLSESNSSDADPRETLQEIINTVKRKDELTGNANLVKKTFQIPEDKDLVSKSNIIKKDYSKEDAKYINSVLQGYKNVKYPVSIDKDAVSLEPGIDQLRDILNIADFRSSEENFSSPGLEFLMNIGQILKDSMEGMRDSMYINEYAMGNFKNILSQNTAYDNQPEKDFSGILKSKRNTYYEGELEYILCGMKDQQKNIYAVEAQILLVRFALNTLAIYMDSEKVAKALAIAETIAGFTVFGVPAVQTMILLGWSLAESIVDVKIIMGGGKVPVYKLKNDWFLDQTTAFKDFAKGTAGQTGKKVIDFGESKIEDLTVAAKEKIDSMVESKVSNAVDRVFAPLEQELNSSGDIVEDSSKKILEGFDTVVNEGQGSTSRELQKTIAALAADEFNTCRADIEEKIKNQPSDIALSIINERKSIINNIIKSKVSTFTERLKTEVNEAAAKGAGKLKEYLSTNLGDASNAGSSAGGMVISSMTAMGYQDYLRLFLLMRGNNAKLLRIADLIQLNMRLESHDNSFSLENCNTYIRLKATVSMKYLFMTSAIVPKGTRLKPESRHRINLLIYQGY